ncbi:MAG: serine hydrolase, partial [Bradyrhizobium sp.]|nr:serine hydrolase [Bradyrhizobium sp.]
ASHGEAVRRVRTKSGISEIWLAGARVRPERVLRAEMERKFPRGRRKKTI